MLWVTRHTIRINRSATAWLIRRFIDPEPTFRFVAAECGRLGMAVHLHAMAGAGGYFEVAGANPLNLESVLNDPSLRKTNFVMVHGGWPFTREITGC